MCATSDRSDGATGNIALVGFMGSGKSAVGRELARRLGWNFADTDALVEAAAGRPISDIFAQDGETAFRDLETEAVRRASARKRLVIATGGGVVLRAENLAALRKTGVVVLLEVTPGEAYRRVAHERHRPLLQVADPLAKIQELLEMRRPYYAQADVSVSTTGRDIHDIVDEILARTAEPVA